MDNEKIVITRNENIVTAKKYNNKTLVLSAEAKCHSEDTFDFNVGAELAISRLIKKENIVKEHSSALLRNYDFRVKKRFMPYLKYGNENVGIIGAETNFCDIHAEPIYVGDIVTPLPTVFPYDNDCIFTKNGLIKNYGIEPMFIDKYGINTCTINEKEYMVLLIQKFKSYIEIENGTIRNGVQYVKGDKYVI